MSDNIINCKKISEEILNLLSDECQNLKLKFNKRIILNTIVVGHDNNIESYLKSIINKCNKTGVDINIIRFNDTISYNELVNEILAMNEDNTINGIIIQLPLPISLNKQAIFDKIDIIKDVDSLSRYNISNLVIDKDINEDDNISCTALACVEILKNIAFDIVGKKIVIIGKGYKVGLPISLILIKLGGTVVVCDKLTQNIKEITNSADVLISACGVPMLITEDWIKNDTVILDVGINYVDGKLIGDVDYNSVKKKTKLITQVPNGVGQITSTMLIKNTINSFKSMQIKHN